MMEGLFSDDTYSIISKQLGSPQDYFDFPSSLIAFGESLGSSTVFVVDRVFFRKRNKHLTLMTYFCSGPELRKVLDSLLAKGYIIKSLNFVNKDTTGFVTKNYMREYTIDSSYSIENHCATLTAKHRGNILRDIRKCENLYYVSNEIGPREADRVFHIWADGAKDRHFMIIKGHYLKYIERFFQQPNNVIFRAFRRKSDGVLYGFAGFEVVGKFAQMTIMKHRFGDSCFPTYFWAQTTKEILATGVEKVFCGSTADVLKQRIGFTSHKSVKVVI